MPGDADIIEPSKTTLGVLKVPAIGQSRRQMAPGAAGTQLEPKSGGSSSSASTASSWRHCDRVMRLCQDHRVVGLDAADPITVPDKPIEEEPTGKANPGCCGCINHGHDMAIVDGSAVSA